tara:strand:+ start:411 stop:584 length:174 start_codon:yes stop_codon:yes gene_type:complete
MCKHNEDDFLKLDSGEEDDNALEYITEIETKSMILRNDQVNTIMSKADEKLSNPFLE